MNTLIIGKTSEGKNVPVLVDEDGKIVFDANFTGDITLGAVAIDHTTPGTTDAVVVSSSALPTGAATQTTLAAILAKLLSAPATEAKQDTGNSSLATIAAGMATQTTLAAILAKIIAAPATEATLAALEAKVDTCNTGAVVIASGAVVASDPTVSVAKTTALAASLVVKSAAGSLMSISGYNSGPAQWIQIHNTASVPANTEVPLAVYAVSAQSTFFFEWQKGLPCSTGITVCNSYGADPATAAAAKTIGSNDCFFTATYL